MPSLHYFAAYTDSGCLIGCDHEHATVTSAANCLTVAGSYVIAVENGELRELNRGEELEFQPARYGGDRAVVRSLIRLWPKPVLPDSN